MHDEHSKTGDPAVGSTRLLVPCCAMGAAVIFGFVAQYEDGQALAGVPHWWAMLGCVFSAGVAVGCLIGLRTNAASQWRRAKDAWNSRETQSRRPLHSPGWAVPGPPSGLGQSTSSSVGATCL
jgi:hypothetical protein